MNRNRLAAGAVAVASAVLLTACAGGSVPTAEGTGAAPTPTPTAENVEPAASCLQIDTTESTVDGTALGTCFADAILAYGSAKARSDLDGEVQEAEFRLRPDAAIHGTGPDGEVVLVDDVTYRNDGSGWVKGDAGSDDPDEYVIGVAGLAMLAMFNGEMMKQSIAACPVWNIEVGEKKITLPDDQVVEARVFSCAAPFDSFGTTVSPMSVWFGADWTPYGHESTASGYGQVVHGISLYYDHGEPVEITAPM